MPTYTTGAAAAEAVNDELKKERGSRFRVSQLFIKDGEKHVLHFVTDLGGLLSFDAHQFVPTKPKPDEYKGSKWPDKMWGICPRSREFRVYANGKPTDEFEEGYGTCYIHDHFAGVKDPKYGKDISWPTYLTWGIAVVRKPVEDAVTRKVTGFADELVEYRDEKGDSHQVPRLVLIAQRIDRFWAPLQASGYVTGTICDQDYLVSRKENDYNIASVVATPHLRPGQPAWKAYEDTLKLLGFDLAEFLVERASEDYYARWFDPSKTPRDGYARKEEHADEEADATTDATTPQVNQDALDELRGEFRARSGAK